MVCQPLERSEANPPKPSAAASGASTPLLQAAIPSEAALDKRMKESLNRFMQDGDETRLRAALNEEVRVRRKGGAAVLRHYMDDRAHSCETMVIAFGGLQQHIGGGHSGGMPPHEFVRSCTKAGARYALFVRDASRSWYCRGLGDGAFGDAAAGNTFESMVAGLRAEIDRLAPARVVTIGSSMGGYAAIRAGIALNADRAVAFSPQVLLHPDERRGAALEPMHFDELLSWLRLAASAEGFAMRSLVEAVREAPPSIFTAVEVHVGASEHGDVYEAERLQAAVDERHAAGDGGGGGGGGVASRALSCTTFVHANRSHNLVLQLRDAGELYEMLFRWLAPSAAPADPSPSSPSPSSSSSAFALFRPSRAAASQAAGGMGTAAGGTTDERAAAALDDLDAALGELDTALQHAPLDAALWTQRAQILERLGRFVDGMRMVGHARALVARRVEACGEGTNAPEARALAATLERVQAALTHELEALGKALPALSAVAGAADDAIGRIVAFERILVLDPTSVYARLELAAMRVTDAIGLQAKAAKRAKGACSRASIPLALEAYEMLTAVVADVGAYAAPPPAPNTRGALDLAQVLGERRPNCPLPPAPYLQRFIGRAELLLGQACDALHADGYGVSGAGAGGGAGGRAGANRARAGANSGGGVAHCGGRNVEPSIDHYARSAAADGSTWQLYDAWHWALEKDTRYEGQPERRRAAQRAVHLKGVHAGVYAHPAQRPSQLLPGLLACAWHDPQQHAALRALLTAKSKIRAEALSLLRADAQHADRAESFAPYLSAVLVSGDWSDVGLYYNGRQNVANTQRAPFTSKLLRSDEALRRDATSCPFGSAYFSLLRPGTRLAAHCGPTNGRLRAHLGLVVPEGDCCIRCGDEPPRRWAEGEILLFDDSFEHEVWNLTKYPRVVLIVDLWHPGLDTDAKRLAALQTDAERECYLGVVDRDEYQMTTERGH